MPDQSIEPVRSIKVDAEASVTHTAAYAPDISLKSLELSCERDEINWFAKIKTLQLAELEDGSKATAAIYEETADMDLGELKFVAYKTQIEEDGARTANAPLGEPLKGRAFIQGEITKVLVFREKP